MKTLSLISTISLPIFVFIVVGYGLVKKVDIYEEFIAGAKGGIQIVFKILPYIVGMIFAVDIFKASAALTPFLRFWQSPSPGLASRRRCFPSISCGPFPAAPAWACWPGFSPNTAQIPSSGGWHARSWAVRRRCFIPSLSILAAWGSPKPAMSSPWLSLLTPSASCFPASSAIWFSDDPLEENAQMV